jgi:hypothetical protein
MGNLVANDHSRTWLQVFNNSKVNGAPYRGDYLPAHSWDWPTDTYLQRRLLILRGHASRETEAGTPAGTEKCQDKEIFSPARVLNPLLERGDSLVGYPKNPRKRRRIPRAVGATKQRRQSS